MLRLRTLNKTLYRPKPILGLRLGSGSAHHDDHHHHDGEEPSGRFLGLKAGRPFYFWEPIWYVGFYGSFAVFFALEYFSPKKGPNELARIEAMKRLEARGESATAWPFPAK
ncbi:hypothetical protein HK103_000898 [Boothiomyces macroporosus]|uniref:NADH-ubiquinone oxidoreductase ESSS subunit n=1 Tax=Boothiomyces macroporosus TaxID=261099 RepID=A0AAD5UJY0_9FUNG|nr:hypothetical protein HK103_000898 [Boothiomyces macroporosus]